MDKIKNALTEKQKSPKDYKNCPTVFFPKIQKKTPNITKRTLKCQCQMSEDPKGLYCNFWGPFVLFREI